MTLSRKPLLILAGLLAGLLCSQQSVAGSFSQIGSSRWVTVAKIYDGDTFRTKKGEKVRLLGIDTPELARDDHPAEPMARTAKSTLQRLIGGKIVQLQFDSDKKDRYRRTLAHIYLRDGTWINGELVESGMAHVYTFAPNFKHCKELLAKERYARTTKEGIWRTERFKPLNSTKVSHNHIGQFRVVSGSVSELKKSGWSFKMNSLHISIPRAHRQWFEDTPKLKSGDIITVHGKIRISSRGRLYLALHSPCDLEKLQ